MITDTRPTVLLDIDGTLRDTGGILHYVTGPVKDYDAFYAACVDCPPITRVIETVKQQFCNSRWRIVITSGQPEQYRTENERWLAAHLGRFDWVCLRQAGDYRKAPVVKREMLARIRAYGYRPVEAWDDDPAVIEMYAAEGLVAHEVYRSERLAGG